MAKRLTTINRLKISLVSGVEDFQTEGEETIRKKYSICDENGEEILSGKQRESKDNCPLKSIILENNVGEELRKIVHRIGLTVVSICTAKGVVLGETTVSVGFGCCCTIKPRYTFRLKSGKDTLTMNGKISCCQPRLKMKVMGEHGKVIGSILMGNTLSYQCDIQFVADASSEEERTTIVALCVGMLDSTYEKQLINKQNGTTESGISPTENKRRKRVFRLVSIRL